MAVGTIGRVGSQRLIVDSPVADPAGPPFSDVLTRTLAASGIRVSAHAQRRLASAATGDVSAADRLTSAVSRAEQRGAAQSVILVDDLAFVVSVRNRTVVTAVERGRAADGVFTNIDSVVIG